MTAAKPSAAAFNPEAVKIKRQLTFPTLQMKPGSPVYFTIKSLIEISKSTVKKKGDENRKPASVMNVMDKMDGIEKTIVVNKVLEGKLNESYPNGGYIGLSFMSTKSKEKKKGGDGEYYDFDLAEID